MRKTGSQFICDRCGRTIFVEGVNGRARFPMDWYRFRTENVTHHLCARCKEEYEQAKRTLAEFEFRPEATEHVSGDMIVLDKDGMPVQ